MAKRIAEIIVLAEDNNQAKFARLYLERAGHDSRRIRVRPPAQGKGSGEQYVREHYTDEVRYYRNRSSHRTAALVVVTDADTMIVGEREGKLKNALASAGQNPRQPREAIALFIPKRNIETWILCLTGERVNEKQDYADHGDIQPRIKPAAETFHEWSRPNYQVPTHCVDSLRRGLSEVQRIP